MLRKIRQYVRYLNFIKNEQKGNEAGSRENGGREPIAIDKKIGRNEAALKNTFGKSKDVIIRKFKIGIRNETEAFVCFIDGLADKALIDESILKPLTTNIHLIDPDEKLIGRDLYGEAKDCLLNASELWEETSLHAVTNAVLSGDTALLIDGYPTAMIVSVKGAKTRDIKEPDTEPIIRGPHEGFVETLRVNTSLLRRIIKNPNLTFESLKLGKQTNTEINVAYINGIADGKIVEEVKRRLNRIDIDAILESGYVEQLIEDNPLSPFSTIGNSERPDKVAAKLLEGRVAILCEGTPFVLTVPYLFVESLQITEDYYSRPYLSSFIRLIRFLAFLLTLLLPALYVALETFDPEMIPTVLLVTAAASREGIPFPSLVETLIMLIIFELLRESGVRLPRQVGQAVSIVGALVIGDAAVRAGIISAPMVIIGALTGITSFIVTPLLDGIILFRLFLLFSGAAFGLYGITVGLFIMLSHMCSLRSFGVPYLSPVAPTVWKDLKDSLIRAPLRLMKSRPASIEPENLTRENFSTPPNKSGNQRNEKH